MKKVFYMLLILLLIGCGTEAIDESVSTDNYEEEYEDDSEEVVVKESKTTNKSYNPIKDNDSFLVRIFRGRVDRI